MKLIKACRVYAAELPLINELEKILQEHAFSELTAYQGNGAGFVPLCNFKFVLDFGSGFAFKVRYDEKILPAGVIKSHLDKRIAELEGDQLRKVPAKERAVIKEEIINELLPKAFSKEQYVTCFYWKKDSLLIVPTASSKLAGIVTSSLIRAVGSIKTRTIHVGGVKQSLTSKLKAYLQDAQGIPDFQFDSSVKLKDENGKVVTIRGADLDTAKDGILEALSQYSQVIEMGMSTDDVFFKLAHDFVIRGVAFIGEPEPEEFEDEVEQFTHFAAVQTTLLADVILKLMSLFEYKATTDESEIADYV